jgi:hypothetical protein
MRAAVNIGSFVLLALACAMPAAASHAQSDDDRYTIMRPEKPGPMQKFKSQYGSSNPVYPTPLPAPQGYIPPRSHEVKTHPTAVPPNMYVPQTGQVLPNLPTVSGSGRGGAETSQDRAVRCAHQAGVYGAAAGDRNAYVGSCVNQ